MAMALPVVRARLTVVRERPLEPFLERRSRPPAEGPRDLADVRVEVARLLRLSLGGEGRELPARAREGRERLGDLAKRRRLAAAHIQDLAERRVLSRREEDRLHAVVDVEEIAQDRPVAEDGDRRAVEREAHEPVHDAVARMAHLGPRAVDVREAQYRPLDPVDVPVYLDDLRRGEVRDLVEAARVRGRIFGHGQRVRAAVLAARPRVDDARGRVVPLEGFHEDGRAPDVDVDVRERVREGEDVVHLPREVEDDVLAAHGPAHRLRIADVRYVDGDAALHGLEVEKVAAVARDHRVHDADRRAAFGERDREVAPDEPGAARHEGASAREGRGDTHAPILSSRSAIRRAAWSHVQRVAISAAARPPFAAASSRCSTTWRKRCARCSGSGSAHRKPLSYGARASAGTRPRMRSGYEIPPWTNSVCAPQSVAMDGSPQAIASMSGMSQPSPPTRAPHT